MHILLYFISPHRPLVCITKDWAGVKASLGPHIVLGPEICVFFSELRKRFPKPSTVSVSSSSTLLITGGGDVTIEALDLDGALVIKVSSAIAESGVKVPNFAFCCEAPYDRGTTFGAIIRQESTQTSLPCQLCCLCLSCS